MSFPYKADPEQARQFLISYFERLQAEPILHNAGRRLKTLAVLCIPDLALEIAVDSRSGRGIVVPLDPPPGPAEVRVTLTSDVLHALLTGRLNVAVAYTRGQLTVAGNLAGLRLLYPFMEWGVALYREHLRAQAGGAI